jgi:hypothetical protein
VVCTLNEHFQAIAQGCLNRFGAPLDPGEVKAGCIDEEMWLQEYCCQFISTAAQWIPPELFDANISDDAHDGFPLDEEPICWVGYRA